jgi:hypothetical protein
MDTRQYTKSERKTMKRAQRTPAYKALQRRARESTEQLESITRIRNSRIETLEGMLKSVAVRAVDGTLTNAILKEEVKTEIVKLLGT